LLACCVAGSHHWDRYEVARVWAPQHLCCFIIGENPGAADSEYFYAKPESYAEDPVDVRRRLLRGLRDERLIAEPTLEAFREAGFLFDHGIRCSLPRRVVRAEHRAAMRYASTRVGRAPHLVPFLSQAPTVWVMGHIASNAVANACEAAGCDPFPKKRRQISKPPYPGELGPGSKFFLSRYLTRCYDAEVSNICRAFGVFARARSISAGSSNFS